MQKLINKKRKSIGQRIKLIRKELGLTQIELAKGASVSKGTINAIESGNKGCQLENLLAVGYFFGMELEEIATPTAPPQNALQLRDNIISFHKKHNSKEYKILNKKPRIVNALRHKILSTDFLDTPKEVKDILDYCKTEYDWVYKSSSMSNALKALIKEGKIKMIPSPTKTGINEYVKKISNKKE